MHWTTAAA
ncbi:hypothetical protein SAM23877_7386 [Streptomyces ambofaciens ATCC 23877]|uniref:Uncharacterized protein n=1 Tax=Streptomyces ambofaciens (strain ATCC 23877 / 3486 / DSM 40053 / JCM 4204 / NBRC 12836 / NRRL B-2516) TaxID=278992 RepID=A0A0K2B5V0_STRA7|nr:hypothetical protein SAM23877_7386 [Streptomyces ambofaciens ATCC 23877]